MRQATPASEAASVQRLADDVAALVGVPWTPSSGSGPMDVLACTGKRGEAATSVFYIFSGYFFKVGADRVVPVIEQVHRYWTSLGWQVEEIERFQSGGARATAVDPSTGNELQIFDTKEPSTVTLSISTTCAQDPGGAPPFGPYNMPGSAAPSTT